MKVENLIIYELEKRAEAIKQKPDSRALKLANAAFDLIHNESFTTNPAKFLADPLEFTKLSPYHKSVITTVYGICFRAPIR